MNEEHVTDILNLKLSLKYMRKSFFYSFLEWNSNPEIRERLDKWETDNLFTPLVRDYMKRGYEEIKACWLAQIHMHNECGRN